MPNPYTSKWKALLDVETPPVDNPGDTRRRVGLFRGGADPGSNGDAGSRQHCRDTDATSEYPGTGSHGRVDADSNETTHCRTNGDAGQYTDPDPGTGTQGNTETATGIDSNGKAHRCKDGDAGDLTNP